MIFQPKKTLTAALALATGLTTTPGTAAPDYQDISNPFLGDAYMVYQQGDQLQSMVILMTADELNRLGRDGELGGLFLADGYAKLGLHDQAIKAYSQLARSDKTSHASVDSAWLEIAKLNLEQERPDAALGALKNIKHTLSSEQKTEFDATTSRALLTQGKVNQAIAALPNVADASTWALYQTFNIGVTLLDEYQNKNGAVVLHQIARLKHNDDNEIRAIQDQANLALGFSLLKINQPQKARGYLENVRLKSHLSDPALLGMGWSYSIEDNYDQALVFWLELKNRTNSSAYRYETMLAVPFALGKAQAYRQAIQHYQAAQQQIDADTQGMDEAKKIINSSLFPQLISAAPEQEADWLTQWMDSPEAPEQRFLPLLLDNPEFQAALKEYRALLQLNGRLQTFGTELKQFETAHLSMSTSDEIAGLRARFRKAKQRTQQGLELQLTMLRQQATKTLSRYQAQFNEYSKQIKFGMAQAIEGATFAAEEQL